MRRLLRLGWRSFLQRLGFDLADTLTRDVEFLANLFEGAISAVLQTKAQLQAPSSPRGVKRRQDILQLLLEQGVGSGICRSRCIRVLRNEIAQMAVLLFADRRFQRNRFLCNAHDLADLVDRHIQFFCDFLRCRIVSVFMQQLAGNLLDLIDGFHHVYRDTDGACLICNRPGDGLTNPPGRIGGEFKALGVIEFFHRFDQTQVAFLDQIQKLHSASDIPFGNADHQSEVGLRKPFFGILVPV